MLENRFQNLVSKFLKNELSESETKELEEFLENSDGQEVFNETILFALLKHHDYVNRQSPKSNN